VARDKAWEDGIDKSLNKIGDMQQSIRVSIGGAYISVMGNKWFDPQTLYFDKLPQLFADRIVILKMLSNKGEIPEVGRRHNSTTYYLYITPNEWKAIKHEAVPMTQYQFNLGEENEHKKSKHN